MRRIAVRAEEKESRMMKKIAFVAGVAVAASAVLSVFAWSAEPDGTDFVVTADAGESYTYSTAVGNYTRLVKRGAGEVVLTAATTAFTGEVVVEAGTLSITSFGAVGSGTPITVQNGATFWIKTEVATGGQNTARFNGHTITIAGHGVDDMGAFRYMQTGGGQLADNLLDHLVLADDATVEVASRWGMYNSAAVLDLAGHTLTRIGTSNWMIFNTITAGTIMNTEGTLTLQNTPTINLDTTIVITNSTLALWGCTGTGIKGMVKLYTGSKIEARSGTSSSVNHLGNVHVVGTSGKSVTLSTAYNGAARSMSIDGALTGDSGIGVAVSGVGSLSLNGDINLPGGANNLEFNNGRVYLNTDASRSFRTKQYNGNVVSQAAGRTLVRMLRIANGGATSAAFRQTGGIFAVPSGDNGRIGEPTGSRGYFTLEGGEAHFSNTTYIAEKQGSFGAFRQTGGLSEMKNAGFSGVFYAGCGGSGLFVQTGGTNDTLVRATVQDGGFCMSTNGTGEATISGTGTLFRTTLLNLGAARSVCTNILNVMNGAVLTANRFRKGDTAAAGARAYVNVDGATFMPTFAWGWTANTYGSGEAFFKRSPDHFVIWKKGFVFDTSENAANSSGTGATSIPFWFEAPTGKGVESVALPTDSGFIATNYIGIARVVFEDATGWGASAYAEYDFSSKKVTKIVVTSRGCDYSDDAKAYLESPDRKTRYECALTLSSNEGMCGEFVKRGAPTLELYGTNTLTAGIAVEGGSLIAYTTGVIPSNTPVRVESGATLDLANKGGITVSTFTGAGNVARGSVTVTNAVRASCADIFAGKYAAFSSNLTFKAGATFTITDPENLSAYAHSGTKPAFTASTVNGTPELAFEGEPPQGVKWALFKKSAGTYNFGAIVGTMLLVR